METRQYLDAAARQLNTLLTGTQLDSLLNYLEMIKKWNRAYNLVGTSSTDELLQKHILDSLSIMQFIQMSPVLDVGSGAGLPGIPLAIALPDISFTLLDSNGKKARFMRQVALELKLDNVEVVQTRVENYHPDAAPRTVMSRAFAPLEKALQSMTSVCAPLGQVLIMLGTKPIQQPSHNAIKRLQISSINLPGLDSQRHLLIADKV